MSLSITIGNYLYKYAFPLYRPLYTLFKNRQDAFEIQLLEGIVKEGSVVIDIGANIGYYALILSKLAGSTGRVHCFEPDAKNFSYLKQTARSLKNVQLNQKAVGPATGKGKIYTSKELNVDHRTYEPAEYDKVSEIETIALDDYLEGGKVDVIKMDIQGFEMEAVKGMAKTFRLNPKLVLVSEFWPYGLSKAGSSVSAYFKFLDELNFKVQLLKNGQLETLDAKKVSALEGLGKEHYFNIIASRKIV